MEKFLYLLALCAILDGMYDEAERWHNEQMAAIARCVEAP